MLFFSLLFCPISMMHAQTGRVGINTTDPSAMLHVKDSSVVFTSPFYENFPQYDAPPPASGQGARMLWYPQRRAFRAGMVSGTQWDQVNTGFYSFAAGYDAIAAGQGASALGLGTRANGASSLVVGQHNVPVLASPQTVAGPTHPLFIIGNGANANTPSNALLVRMDGRVGIGTNSPTDLLHLNAPAGLNALRVQIDGQTKLRVNDNGGTALGAAVTPPANGLYVQGPVEPAGGIKSATNPILIESTTDSIEIRAGSNRIVVYANGGIKIIGSGASGNGIVIDAGSQDLTLKGGNVTIESTAQTTLTSGTTTTLSAAAILNLNGAMVKLNNGNIPMAKIGSIVMVNPATGIGTVTGNGTATILGN